MLTILPALRSIIAPTTSRETTKAVVRLTSITFRHASVVIWASGARSWMPTLLTRMSIGPPACAARMPRTTSASSLTSMGRGSASRPSLRKAATAASTRGAVRPLISTEAPACAKPRAKDKPKP